ncbi:hypothetical protein [Alkaliphilus sp. B6464]|uniref:hypothetical protein n=1 Tax=Alkaliphilus sp. B6464 TaxID=2731219 RepID=UPI001BA9F1BB|nr:hypothetical protein [Alkaliphilus sp. B6464]QUH20217.1 hypothetical protein HYG84_10055 [Alkaliphilus sp. B6464]
MFEFEEKESFTLDEVKRLVAGWKSEYDQLMQEKETTINDLNTKVEGIAELERANKDLTIKHLALQNGISEDMLDLVADDNLEVVSAKIAKLKELTKKQNIDNSYKPDQKRKDDDYSKAEKSNDVEGMLKSKLGRLFG